jgi:hypothetical protein
MRNRKNTLFYRKFSAIFLSALLVLCANTPLWAQDLILEEKSSEPIARGVIYENIKRFTSEGWLNLHVLTVDLTDPTIKVDVLLNEAIKDRSTLSAMAQKQGAVAAINGDFFSTSGDTAPIGPVLHGDTLLATPSLRDDLGVLAFTQDRIPYISYWKFSGKISNSRGKSMNLGGINKPNATQQLVIYNQYWGKNTLGANETRPDLVEMVVEKNRVREIRAAQPPTEIPKDGYIVAGRGSAGQFLIDNFHVGDRVYTEITTIPDWERFSTAMGGGAILVENGAVAPYKHNITGLNPRSAIGVNEANTKLFLVVVDGRQQSSRGMTQEELANFMISIGSYTAINLDGGGSSALVGRELGKNSIISLNTPSEGRQRLIPIGLGVFSEAPKGGLSGLRIKATSTLIPLSGTRTFYILGYDSNYNPVEINTADVEWSVTPNLGTFERNVFTAAKSGEGTVTARIGSVTATYPIQVMDEAVKIEVLPKEISLKPGEKKTLTAVAIDAKGYRSVLEASDVTYEVVGNIGTISGNTFTAGEVPGVGAIVAKGLHTAGGSPARVFLEGYQTVASFEEEEQVAFEGLSWPEAVQATAASSAEGEPVHGGTASLKLGYDFTGEDATRAAYVIFPKGIELPQGSKTFGIWVYGDGGNNHWLKARFFDADKKEHTISLARNVNWQGWEYVSYQLPAEVKQPVTLSRIYLAEIDPNIKDRGEIFFDDLKVEILPSFDFSLLPQQEEKDPAQKEVSLTQGSWQFSLFGDLSLAEDNYPQAKGTAVKKYVRLLNKSKSSLAIFMGELFANSAANQDVLRNNWLPVKKAYTSTDERVRSFDFKDAHFIFLNNRSRSLRTTGTGQWQWFLNDLNSTTSKNIFVLLPKPVWDDEKGFTDSLEADLFNKTIEEHQKKTGAAVWVLVGGKNKFEWMMKNGVRYLTIPGPDAAEKGETPSYVQITIKEGEPTYQVIPVK